eukprot:6467555-Amphidinium_carterae.6
MLPHHDHVTALKPRMLCTRHLQSLVYNCGLLGESFGQHGQQQELQQFVHCRICHGCLHSPLFLAGEVCTQCSTIEGDLGLLRQDGVAGNSDLHLEP